MRNFYTDSLAIAGKKRYNYIIYLFYFICSISSVFGRKDAPRGARYTMKQLWRYISPHSLYIFFTVLIKLAGALLELLIPFFMEIILDDVVPAGQTGAIFLYGSLMLLAAGGCLAGNIIANRMSAISSGKITQRMRSYPFHPAVRRR